jgi:hypothetical protein
MQQVRIEDTTWQANFNIIQDFMTDWQRVGKLNQILLGILRTRVNTGAATSETWIILKVL